jgi:hypothetical protein
LLSPTDGARVIKGPVHLDWTDSACATYYKLVVKQHSKQGPVVVRQKHLLNSDADITLTPARDDIYYWHVKACNPLGCSKWSRYQSFRFFPQSTWQFDDWLAALLNTVAMR